uniref:CUT domain-containing protein n=1 Tax=Elaeophora elaphi TaxID=1147741 RepID=A0A0R3S375_9BILA
MYSNNKEQEMVPRRKHFGTPRFLTSMKNNRLDSPFRSPYAPPTSPQYPTISSSHSSFRHRLPYQNQKRPYCHLPAPTYSVNNLTSAQHPPNWHGPSRTSSSYIYKNPQNMVGASRLLGLKELQVMKMVQGRGGFCTSSPGNRRHNHKNSQTECLAKQFDVNDYVIPAMTANPWSKLEELYANRRLDEH